MKLFWSIYLLTFTLATWLILYFIVISKTNLEERCTEHTLGRIRRYSNVKNGNVFLPLVEYQIGEKTYTQVGPKFKKIKEVTKSNPTNDLKANIETNLTTRDNLPQNLEVTYFVNSFISIKQSPLQELYPIGATDVDVYYNPANPKESYIQRYVEINKSIKIILWASAIITTLISIIIIYLMMTNQIFS